MTDRQQRLGSSSGRAGGSRPAGWCGVDVGTSGVRVVVLGEDGRVLGAGSAPLPPSRHEGGRSEQDPQAWWPAVVAAMRTALAQSEPVELQALAVDATSGTVLVEQADGRPGGPALMYDDARAAGELERVQAAGAELWQALGYRMQAVWALPKIVWLLGAGVLRRGDRVVHQSDHVVRGFTGTPVATDTSHALKSGVDPRTAAWPLEVLGELGVPGALLPDVVLPGARLGVVGAAAAAATGLPAGLPVLAGMTDGCAAQIAAGAVRPGRWSSALGTTLVLKGATDALVHDRGGAVYSHRNPDGGWLPGGASSTGAGVLRLAFPQAGPAGLDELARAADELGLPAAVTYPLAGRGERFPFVAPDAEGFGDPVDAEPAARFSALCHGIAYVERLAYDVLAGAGADTSGAVAVSGGTVANAWWNQLRADVLGRPVLVPESVEAAAGMAVLAAAPPGRLADTADRMVRIAARHEPGPDRAQALGEGYLALVAALAERGWLDAATADAASARSAAA